MRWIGGPECSAALGERACSRSAVKLASGEIGVRCGRQQTRPAARLRLVFARSEVTDAWPARVELQGNRVVFGRCGPLATQRRGPLTQACGSFENGCVNDGDSANWLRAELDGAGLVTARP
jgi:hypothetical protein